MSILYNLLIQPLVLVYDILFTLLYGLIGNPVLSIMALSIVINLIILPLYQKADALQKAEQAKARQTKPWIDHIRRNFSGDERFMLLSAYYRIEHYNPASAMKEAGPLLLQIPFFIAAYRYISSIPILEGASFGSIQDLLKPDGLITVAGISINVLPILMTALNMISGAIYSRGGPLRQKIQIYCTAMIFLALLYNSPSGLVIYWTMNNLFSLGKNIYSIHMPNNKRLLQTISSIIVIPLISLGMIIGDIASDIDIFLAECIMACAFINIVITILQSYHVRMPGFIQRLSSWISGTGRQSVLYILLPELALTLLFGFYIPLTTIASSPTEFTDTATGLLRFELLSYPAIVYAGLFLIWSTIMILSRDEKKRNTLTILLWCVVGIALTNQFLFPAKTGALYTDLSFDGRLRFAAWSVVLNILCCVLMCGIVMLIYKKNKRVLIKIITVISLSLLGLSLINYHSIARTINSVTEGQTGNPSDTTPISLSKTGTNVVVMMLDRAIGGYVPYIFDELSELKGAYRGFVFYPNTISFGTHTNFGAPGIFGGYEYSPHESNKRDTISLKDKHNEALKLMPILFSEVGYEVSVIDPPYANYKFTTDVSIYDDMPNVQAYNLTGRFTSRLRGMIKGDPLARQRHNFLIYSIFRTVPLFMKDMIYDEGNYITINTSVSYTEELINSYSVLASLNELTTIIDDAQDRFLMFQNETPHNPTVLNPPYYAVDGQAPEGEYSDKELDGRILKIRDPSGWGHYCINVATYKAVAKWLDYLEKQGVYDNTRIILVADHGQSLGQFDDLIHSDGLDIEGLNPLLMVKDFNADGNWTICSEFMSNADVPSLAMRDLIVNPINPYTGHPVNDDLKKRGPLIITDSDNWQVINNNGKTFDLGNGHWWSVHDYIFDMDNWEKIEEGTGK